MHDILNLAGSNLLSPPVLFLALGFAASFARSDLEVPQAVAKALSLYLLLAIEFKGGVAVASHGLDAKLLSTLAAGGDAACHPGSAAEYLSQPVARDYVPV